MSTKPTQPTTVALTISLIALGIAIAFVQPPSRRPAQAKQPPAEVATPARAAPQRTGRTAIERLSNESLIAYFREMSDSGEILEQILAEMVRRGDPEFIPEVESLALSFKKEVVELESEIARLTGLLPRDGRPWEQWTEQEQDYLDQQSDAEYDLEYTAANLETLTALRRLQGRPDPMQIFVTGFAPSRYVQWPDMPSLHVSLRNIDTLQQPVGYTRGGDNRSGRFERFKIQVRETQTDRLIVELVPSPSVIAGGISMSGMLPFGEGWQTTLPLADYVPQLEPGNYLIRVLYHDAVSIAKRTSTDGLICCQSREYALTVEDRVIWHTPKEAAAIDSLLEHFDRSQHVRIVQGRYGVWASRLVPMDSHLGRILTAGWNAVPALLKELDNESQTPTDRAHTLAMLYSITGLIDPRGGRTFLGNHWPSDKSAIGPHESVSRGTSVSYNEDGGGVGSSGSFGFGSLKRVGLPELKPTNLTTTNRVLDDPAFKAMMEKLIASQPPSPKMEVDAATQAVFVNQWRELRKKITIADPKNPPPGSGLGGGGMGLGGTSGGGLF